MKKRDIALVVGGGIAAAVAVKLLTRPENVDFDAIAGALPHSDHSHFVSVDGIEIHYQEFGDLSAPPMILIHGYTASSYVWKTAGPKLADAGFRVIAIDLIGVLLVCVLVLMGSVTAQQAFLDVAMVVALISFVGTVAYARYIEREGA